MKKSDVFIHFGMCFFTAGIILNATKYIKVIPFLGLGLILLGGLLSELNNGKY